MGPLGNTPKVRINHTCFILTKEPRQVNQLIILEIIFSQWPFQFKLQIHKRLLFFKYKIIQHYKDKTTEQALLFFLILSDTDKQVKLGVFSTQVPCS
jgi:hypothetical protein